ncbi:MAG TPA: FG-GAP-like repeat-containing protein, partial [Terriglobales bacterium]|nr:FG-GAP-like repeat-containing protein [Terriglobales bacterium]
KRAACLSIFVTLVLLPSFASESQIDQHARFNASLKSAGAQRNAVTRHGRVRAHSAASARMMGMNPAPSQIGFLGANQTFAGGSTASAFPAVLGDFTGRGKKLDVATVVNTTGIGYQISVALSNGDGTFTSKSTTTTSTDPNPDPLWVGDLNGDGKDDLLMGHQATATTKASVDVWLSNGDGTFAFNGNTAVTTTINDSIVWATVTDANGDNKLDFVVADAAAPNGSIWTLLGNGDGTFAAPTSVGFTAQLSLSNPVVFADFNGDGKLDFAGASAANNQIMVYLNNGSGGYLAPAPLTTSDGIYDSCFLAGGQLGTTANGIDLVSANCSDNTLTVYVNNAGTFSPGVYYPSSLSQLAPAQPVAVAIADVNGDGNKDIVVTDQQGSDVVVLLGNGDGTVNDPTVGYAVGGSPQAPAVVADFNQDGFADVMVPDATLNFTYLQGYGDGSFRSAMNYYAQPTQIGNGLLYSVGIASGDFNGDGIPDFVVGNAKSGGHVAGFTVFLSNPDGSMKPGVNYNPGTTTYELEYVAVADFDGDGNLDIAATDANGGVWIFAGDGTGNFTVTSSPFATDAQGGSAAFGVIASDFNGDGKPDLAVVNSGATGDVGVLINTSTGPGNFSFAAPSPVLPLSSTSVAEITAADLGNKQTGFVVPLFGAGAVALFPGNGDGTFQTGSFPLTNCVNGQPCQKPVEAAIADVNGDGIPDIIVTVNDQGITQGAVVALGTGVGTFQSTMHLFPCSLQSQNFGAPDPNGVKIVDLNRDGKPDIICTNPNFGTVSVLYGKGDGTFYDPIEFPAGHQPWDIAIADVNGDGALDVVVSDDGQDFSGITVLLNTSADSVQPPASSLNPTQAGASVTFSTTVTGSQVRGVTALPTGNVMFFDGSTPLGSAALNSGQASLTTGLPVGSGTHSITAQYVGDLHYLPVTSSAIVQVVSQSPDGTALVSSANPAYPGETVTFTATVASTLSGDMLPPTGQITFSDGSTALGSAPLNSSGVATLTTTTLAVGSHGITAQYGGDTNFPASQSSVLNEAVAQPNYNLTANPTSQSVNPGSAASYVITLAPSAGYDGTVTISCPSSLPSGVTCNNPSIAQGKTQATLTVSTTGPGAALTAPDVKRHQGESNLWASLGGVGLVGMILAGEWKKRNRRALGIVLTVLAVMMILALAGCGSGGSSTGGGGGGGGTPAGSYQLQITATGTAGTNGGNTSPHSLPLTLVVQ